jgi:hypothetical protein
MVGLSRFELLTPRLSSVCSNQLSYRPKPTRDADTSFKELGSENLSVPVLSKLDRTCAHKPLVYQIDLFKRLRLDFALTRSADASATLERR